WAGWAALLGCGFILANVCLQYAAVRLSASVISVIMLSEVLFASASSVALGAAVLGTRIWLGGALIVAAAVWSALAPSPGAPAPSHA
ncbi:MAG: EamA family transporter, partial [Variovorax sp.]|nr:EamA family transporter [Variovorax sp.]